MRCFGAGSVEVVQGVRSSHVAADVYLQIDSRGKFAPAVTIVQTDCQVAAYLLIQSEEIMKC